MLTQTGLPCIEACEKHGVEVHVAGVFATGLLVGSDTYAYVVAPEEMLSKVKRWGELAGKYGVSLPAVAIAFSTAPVSPHGQSAFQISLSLMYIVLPIVLLRKTLC